MPVVLDEREENGEEDWYGRENGEEDALGERKNGVEVNVSSKSHSILRG